MGAKDLDLLHLAPGQIGWGPSRSTLAKSKLNLPPGLANRDFVTTRPACGTGGHCRQSLAIAEACDSGLAEFHQRGG